jgi:hypothetical protein
LKRQEDGKLKPHFLRNRPKDPTALPDLKSENSLAKSDKLCRQITIFQRSLK